MKPTLSDSAVLLLAEPGVSINQITKLCRAIIWRRSPLFVSLTISTSVHAVKFL